MPENKITLSVITLSGTYTDDFNIHQKLAHVRDKAFDHLHITPAEGEDWVFTYNGTILDMGQTIQQAGLVDGAQLTLAPREGGGGA